MFSRVDGEFKIKPMNLQNAGEFLVTAAAPTQTVTFLCSPPYKRVLGTVSFGGSFQIEPQPDPSVFSFTMSGVSDPFYGTMSLMIEK